MGTPTLTPSLSRHQIPIRETMTATDIATSSPADASEGPNSKTASPVKEKTPVEVKEEANSLLNAGKRDLLLSNVPDAISKLAQACELLSKAFGETAIETGETYYYYGKALLELSRMESGVLGNALEGVPEEDAAGNTSQFEDPEKMTDQEKDQVNEVVTEAFEENFKELEEKKAKAADAEDKKESSEATKPEGKEEEVKKDGAEGEDAAEAMEEGDDEEVSFENENYKQAVEDIQECLKKQENLPKDA